MKAQVVLFNVQRQGQIYTVLTNQHVLNVGTFYRIQTPDGHIYPAILRRKTVSSRKAF